MRDGNPTTARELMQREARISGLRDFQTPSLEAVERRRFQLWAVVLTVMVVVTLSLVLMSFYPTLPGSAIWNASPVAKFVVVLLALTFSAYVLEKEMALRRLTRLLVDERVLTAALSNRLKELSKLVAVGKAMNSELDLRDVLGIILESAMELLTATRGSVMLREDPSQLRVVAVWENSAAENAVVPIGSGIAGRVFESGEPTLITGPVDPSLFPDVAEQDPPVESAMCIPLVNRGEILGVLNVSTSAGHAFSQYDLRAMTIFAEHAAMSIANARLYDAERRRVAQLLELNRMKSEFVAMVSHELRTPLTAIIGSNTTIRTLDLPPAERAEFHDMIDRQGRRLLAVIEELLLASKLEQESGVRQTPRFVDLAAVARDVVASMGPVTGSVLVQARFPCYVLADPDVLHQVLMNLLDNANKYGAPPITVTVERTNDHVSLSVLDRGPGVMREDRELIFDRFTRLDHDHSVSGIGLGLPIVRQLLAESGGRVWVEDAEGGGAAFRVSLPVAQLEAVPPSDRTPEEASTATG
jgi:two-component system, OmpR family, sensor histidine kinase KdpD